MSKNKKKKKGLRIGHYRIKPLGLGVLAAIILIIVAIVVLVFGNPFGNEGGSYYTRLTATPTPEPTPVPTPTPTPVPTPTPAPTPRAATIRALGEIAVQDNVLEAANNAGTYEFGEMFTYITDVMGNADYTIGNVEGTMGDTLEAKGDEQMVTPSSLITALKESGVDMLNMANDHAADGNLADLTATISKLQAAGMDYVGAAASKAEKDTPKIININGINVGFVAYTDSLNGLEKKVDADTLVYGINLVAKSNAKTDIQALRDAGADVVIACMSWGEMLKREATESQLDLAKALVSCGADVIIGYNPHVIQPATWVEMTDSSGNVTKRTLCLFSAGNFLSDSREQYSDSGVVFQFTIREKADFSGFEIVEPSYIPTYVWRMDNEDGTYEYRTLAAGQWLESAPEGMNYSQYSRLKEVWAEAQSAMGPDVATVAYE